jgi:hypothetical protein
MKGLKWAFTIFIFACSLSHLNAATYYVSPGGSDNNSGTSSGTPWKTIAKVNSFALKAGDVVLFKTGSIWREQLSITKSGYSGSPIKVGSYGTDARPIFSGSDVITGWTQYSGNVWKKSVSSPRQVFFSGIRGQKKTSASACTASRDWYWNSGVLYVYSASAPSNIEAALRAQGVYINAKYVTVENIQVERTYNDGVYLSANCEGVVINNMAVYQWSNEINVGRGGVQLQGKNNTVQNSVFGKATGNEIADQNWAGFLPVYVTGTNMTVANNKIYHNSLENESSSGYIAYGIRLSNITGITKVYGNYIYHTGSSGIITTSGSRSGEEVHIYNNIIEYPGQAGIAAYKTRGTDGVGGKGYVYGNNVSYANRLGNDVGGNGNQASGIHFNDGSQSSTSTSQPFMKWYCYENEVHHNYTPKDPNTPDANGISMDFNANGVEVYRNLLHDNAGKAIEVWNADNCKLYYNIGYSNDAGITVTSAGGAETANNNMIFNNTLYKNYNGDSRGPNYNTEMYFGQNSKNNTIKNNILYASNYGTAYRYSNLTASGMVVDYNIVYSERGIVGWDSYSSKHTFAAWRSRYPSFDVHSVNADPKFADAGAGNFSLASNSPAINKGSLLGTLLDFAGKALSGVPDIGALEYGSGSGSSDASIPAGTKILLNANAGTLRGDARLGSMTGMRNTRAVYFIGYDGGTSFSVKIPSSGTWYAWARVYCKSSGGRNAFSFNINSKSFTLGDNDNKYDQWYWDGYKGSKITLGTLNAGSYYMSISGKEYGLTLWVDQIVLTNDPNFVPTDSNIGKESAAGEMDETETVIPEVYELSQNFPNPFNPATTIRFSLAEDSPVLLKVYDILGAEVATVIDEVMSAGKHEVKFDGANLASGVYIYRLEAKNFNRTLKMQLLK